MLLVIPIIWIGVHPDPLLRRIEPSVSVLLQEMELRQLHGPDLDAERSELRRLSMAPEQEER